MRQLARWVLRHRRGVVVGWVLAAVAGAAITSITTSRLGETLTLPRLNHCAPTLARSPFTELVEIGSSPSSPHRAATQ